MQNILILSQASTKSAFFQLLGAALFGGVILFAVGFLSMDAAHNAAHDTRHSFAFPCH
ncbi:MAG: CbtB-domain containing protein [Methylococcales bacterium]|jgi:cobalt transporter subunit CbtB|nr:CbtB-domain containing protein [Methylococcales bacterium]MBT7442427.1 CbtB-domain containing protein [Methylococcales bacterium]